MAKFSRAMRAVRMLELSPLVTAATAPARSIPASMRWSRSKPKPTTFWPVKSSGEPLAERVGVLVDHRDRVAAPLQAQGELTAHSSASDYDDVHGTLPPTSGLSRLSVVPRRFESLTAA